jgi:hypothetical protein
MKTTLALAALFLIAACAAPNVGTPRAVAGASGSTYYCWKERLDTFGGDLTCNWEANAADACESTGVVSISKGKVSRGPDNARRCENGQWLVVVTTK